MEHGSGHIGAVRIAVFVPHHDLVTDCLLYTSLALHTGRQVRAPIDIEVLERQLHEWLGEDWQELVENPSMRQAEARRKGCLLYTS